MNLEEQAKAIIDRRRPYHWWNRPRITARECAIIEQVFKQKVAQRQKRVGK